MVRDDFYVSEATVPVDYPLNENIINDKLSARFEEESQTLIITWQGAVSSAEIRQGYAYVMELIQYYKPHKWLMDLQQREIIKRADQRWVFTHFFPEALRLLKSDIFVAIILPVYSFHGLVSELDGDELMQGDNFLIINHFLYHEEARRWLESRKELRA